MCSQSLSPETGSNLIFEWIHRNRYTQRSEGRRAIEGVLSDKEAKGSWLEVLNAARLRYLDAGSCRGDEVNAIIDGNT